MADGSEATAAALLAWANTFEGASPAAAGLAELADGVRVAEMLHDIDPARFEKSLVVRTGSGNWAVAVNNWKRLLKALEAYFAHALELRSDLLSPSTGDDDDNDDNDENDPPLDPTRLAKEKDGRQLAGALSLVLFAAMRAPQDRLRVYVERIMTLPPATQATLKAVFERLQATRMRPLTPSAALALEAEPMDHSFGAAPFPNSPPPHHPGTGRPSLSSAQPSTPSAAQAGAGAGAGASAGLVTPASATRRGISDPGGSGGGAGGTPSHVMQELSRSLRAERDDKERLSQEIAALKTRLGAATDELAAARQQLARAGEEGGEQRKRAEAATARAEELRANCDRLRVRCEEREGELEALRQEGEAHLERARADKEKLEHAEDGARRLADEVDVLRCKAQEAAQLEGQVERYRARLEQASGARQHVKDLEEQNAKYLDQVLALEDEVKAAGALKKAVDQYKERTLELERERFKAVESVQLKEAEAARLREEAEATLDARRFLQEEVETLKRALLAAGGRAGAVGGAMDVGGSGGGGVGGQGLFEDSLSVRERVARLERENRALKQQLEEGGWQNAAGGDGDVLLLQSRVEAAEKLRAEREGEAIASKRRVAELEADIKSLRAQNEELEDEITRIRKEGAVTPAHEKLIAELKAQRAEQKAAIAALEEDKAKLERAFKEKVHEVKEKYVEVLDKLKRTGEELAARNRYLEARIEHDKELQKREERLLMAAVYEAGLDIMQRHLASGPAAHMDPRVAAAAAEQQQQQQQRQTQAAFPARDGDGKGKR